MYRSVRISLFVASSILFVSILEFHHDNGFALASKSKYVFPLVRHATHPNDLGSMIAMCELRNKAHLW